MVPPGQPTLAQPPSQAPSAAILDAQEPKSKILRMKLPVSFGVIFLSATSLALGQSQTKHYLYLTTPDASQEEGRSGNGILIFDMDNGHKFVRRIAIPIFEEGIRGFTGNLKMHRVYYSTSNHRLGCFDLETEKVVWEKTYGMG